MLKIEPMELTDAKGHGCGHWQLVARDNCTGGLFALCNHQHLRSEDARKCRAAQFNLAQLIEERKEKKEPLLPLGPLAVLEGVMKTGLKKYKRADWKRRNDFEDLQHAFEHLKAAMQDQTDEDHIAHAACRLWLVLARRKGEQK